ncbi:MAG TPA: hypothetical protein VGW34_03870 [Allosphingosinicella sp.]|nr:hypothetical protein [Allosphingosinicella sp.]
MTEAVKGVDGGTGAGAEEIGAGAEGGTGGGSGGGGAPEWLGALPEELRGDATLSRYADVPALARAHVEAHKVAKSKLVVPAADAGADVWGPVFDALGRPKDAAGYEIPLRKLPEHIGEEEAGKLTAAHQAAADEFRSFAHNLGLLPAQARQLAEYNNARIEKAEADYVAAGKADIAAFKEEVGADYGAKLAAAKATYLKLGLPTSFANELDQKVGTANLLRGFFKLAELTGEHGRVDGDGGAIGAGGTANAAEQLRTLQKDATWREKLNNGDTTVIAQRDKLLRAAQAQASTR